MEIDWIAVRAFWDASGWEYAFLLLNLGLALYAYRNYLELAGLGNIYEKVAAVADDAARIGAIQNLRRLKTIKKRFDRVEEAVNGTVAFIWKRVERIIVIGLIIPALTITAVVAVSGGIQFLDALTFTLNNLSRGLMLDILEVFEIDPFGSSGDPNLSARLLWVLVVLRVTAEATFWFALLSAFWAVIGSVRLRIPGLRPESLDQLNEKLREAEKKLTAAA